MTGPRTPRRARAQSRSVARARVRAGRALALLSLAGCPRQEVSSEAGASAHTETSSAADDRAREGDEAQVVAVTGPQPRLPGIERPDDVLEQRLRAAVTAKGADYRPRTEHVEGDGRPRFVNRLILETSPYLLQHAHNPVNWYPWGDEAFARAAAEDRPVLLSIGYSTCHWCHVMERESFEDEEIAAYINANFVAIKVDREEHPDVDAVYMDAVRQLSGRGGWPMTVILTPERQPFFAGTYIPARDGDRGSRRGFLTVLREMQRAWREQAQDVLGRSQEVSVALARANATPAGDVPGAEVITRTAERVLGTLDQRWGGFGRAPKFPRPSNLGFLLRYGRRTSGVAGEAAVRAVQLTLTRMAQGGVHDHIGGGFHRYSVDERWLVPHFEKMLYDNAQLSVVLLETAQVTDDARLRETARRTLDYLLREMQGPDGGFWSATDADSPVPGAGEDEEGWFFTWTEEELASVLGPELAGIVQARYATSHGGNFEGRNILHTPRDAATVARGLGLTEEALAQQLESARERLYRHRRTRPRPLLDDKVIAAWNGLAISAMATGHAQLRDDRYLVSARDAATFVLSSMRGEDGRLRRTHREGRAAHPAVLEDYAFVIQGLLDLFETDPNPRWLREALGLQAKLDAHYADSRGGYFASADDGEQLLVRPRPDYDGAEPSGNSVAARNLVRLHALTGDDRWREAAEGIFRAQSQVMRRRGPAVPALLSALDHHLDRSLEIFIVGAEGDPRGGAALEAVLRETFAPSRVVVRMSGGPEPALVSLVPAAEGKIARDGLATAYVCEHGICQTPTSEPPVFRRQLSEVRPYRAAAERASGRAP